MTVKDKDSVTIWQMIRDLVIYSLDRGQFMPVGFLGIVTLIIWRLPAADLKEVALESIRFFQNVGPLGWASSVLIAILWGVHVRWLQKSNQTEMERLVDERNELQSLNTPSSITSSKSKIREKKS